MKSATIGDTRGQRFYVSPRPPSKADGRKGTRKAFKRDNPPGWYWLITATNSNGRFEQYWSC